nr:MAG TPA_asm: hypothetical protein [Caudoviricetes sp.]DAZ43610.1 MAG TPA: hypothetical protein [Caudoviricetes sp.]
MSSIYNGYTLIIVYTKYIHLSMILFLQYFIN